MEKRSSLIEIVFPDICIERSNEYHLSSYVRVKGDDGLYYLRRVRYSSGLMELSGAIQEFVRRCYRDSFDEVGGNWMDVFLEDGSRLFYLDDNQEEESDRVNRVFKYQG